LPLLSYNTEVIKAVALPEGLGAAVSKDPAVIAPSVVV